MRHAEKTVRPGSSMKDSIFGESLTASPHRKVVSTMKENSALGFPHDETY